MEMISGGSGERGGIKSEEDMVMWSVNLNHEAFSIKYELDRYR